MITSMCLPLVCYFQAPAKVLADRVAIKVNDNILTQRKLQLIHKQLPNAYTSSCSGTDPGKKLAQVRDRAVNEGKEQLLFHGKAVESGIAIKRLPKNCWMPTKTTF